MRGVSFLFRKHSCPVVGLPLRSGGREAPEATVAPRRGLRGGVGQETGQEQRDRRPSGEKRKPAPMKSAPTPLVSVGGSERRGCACAPRTLLPGPCDPLHQSSAGRCGPASLPGGGGGRAGRWAAAVLSAVVGVVVGGADTAPSPLSTRSPEPARVSSSR